MTPIEKTEMKITWLEGLYGIRKRRLDEVMKIRWPASDLEIKHRDIEMIEAFLDDYRRVLDRQREAAASAA